MKKIKKYTQKVGFRVVYYYKKRTVQHVFIYFNTTLQVRNQERQNIINPFRQHTFKITFILNNFYLTIDRTIHIKSPPLR